MVCHNFHWLLTHKHFFFYFAAIAFSDNFDGKMAEKQIMNHEE